MSLVASNPTTTANTPSKNQTLWDNYQQQKASNRMLFPLEGAKQLAVSELELMLSSPYSQYMGTECRDVLQALSKFDKVESIVRNEYAVHEKIGRIENVQLGERMGIALNIGGLDLRFFISKWQHMIAVTDTTAADEQSPGSLSIQFYDDAGRAITKIFLRDYSEAAIASWKALIAQYAKDTADTDQVIESLTPPEPSSEWRLKPLAADKRQKLQRKWLALTDIHQFHMLLKSLKLDRASSYHQAPENMAYPLQINAIEELLSLAQSQAKPIMVFVGNSGVVQIQTGIVYQVKRMGDWINILDKKQTDFTLHLKDQSLAQVWAVKRPTKDGIVTCIEGFDKAGNSIVSFFGQRQEGEPEREYWQQMVNTVIQNHHLETI